MYNCTQSMLPYQMSVKPLGATGIMSKTQKAAQRGPVGARQGNFRIDFHISNSKSLELSRELTSWIKGC